ncbi:MAG: alanine racemase [Atopobiaceae bacterium]|nr:alanine racemase [Atopobiaceae bacterium]
MVKDVCPDTRWSWAEINTVALRKNTRLFKQSLSRGVQLMASVKADAYGHGAVPCAKVMLSSGADQLAVATVQEGIELREAGIDAPILILSEPPMECVQTLVNYDLMPTVYTFEFALAYGECASALGTVGRYHVAIDTGMNRIGLKPADLLEFRHSVDFHRGLECAGTFTHFATADTPDDWDFQLQARRFGDSIAALEQAGYDTGLVHCNNTPATLFHPELSYDMCRVGLGLYGLHPSHASMSSVALEAVMSVRGRVTRVAMPSVGEGVSYGFTYRVTRQNIQVATVPIGYADGLSRLLSNQMEVLVHGERCRQVGRICMDQFMFAKDAARASRYNQRPIEYGDVVTVLGVDGDQEITADDIAALRKTISYEVVVDFGMRLERVYL